MCLVGRWTLLNFNPLTVIDIVSKQWRLYHVISNTLLKQIPTHTASSPFVNLNSLVVTCTVASSQTHNHRLCYILITPQWNRRQTLPFTTSSLQVPAVYDKQLSRCRVEFSHRAGHGIHEADPQPVFSAEQFPHPSRRVWSRVPPSLSAADAPAAPTET